MKLREHLKKQSGLLAAAAILIMVGMSAESWSAMGGEGLATTTGEGLVNLIGGMIRKICGVGAPIVLVSGLAVGGIKYQQGDEDAMAIIKGGIVGAVLLFAAWGIASWLFSSL